MPSGPKQVSTGGAADSFVADAVNALPEGSQVTLSGAADAISPNKAGLYHVSRAGVDAMTLAAPNSGDQATGGDDGKEIQLISTTANAHTLTATGLLQTGSASVNVATFAAFAGAGLRLRAFAGKWQVLQQVGITFS